jgi:hypothetical protein
MTAGIPSTASPASTTPLDTTPQAWTILGYTTAPSTFASGALLENGDCFICGSTPCCRAIPTSLVYPTTSTEASSGGGIGVVLIPIGCVFIGVALLIPLWLNSEGTSCWAAGNRVFTYAMVAVL